MHETLDEHMVQRILAANDDMALHNNEHFEECGLFAVNLMSSPGAGKTALLEETCKSFSGSYKVQVIEGDMVGELDAARLRAVGVPVFQICTGRSCHLDAQMVARTLHQQEFEPGFLFIENVGNLVCPAEFPLGEHLRVVLLSVTEGDDKPIKYPVIFRNCDAVVLTKCDLLPFVNFDTAAAMKNVLTLNPDARIFATSTNGMGIREWTNWLEDERRLHTIRKAQHHGGMLNKEHVH